MPGSGRNETTGHCVALHAKRQLLLVLGAIRFKVFLLFVFLVIVGITATPGAFLSTATRRTGAAPDGFGSLARSRHRADSRHLACPDQFFPNFSYERARN